MNNLVVFSGGPGSGKTSAIDRLKELGYTCSPEVGRSVIQQQVKVQGRAVPWDDKTAFRDAVLHEEITRYQLHQASKELVFFDRGVVDSLGYSLFENLAISAPLLNACNQLRYRKQVFIFPPWKLIYTNDDERKQGFVEAVATYQKMLKAYTRFEYDVVELPMSTVEERVTFILEAVNRV